MNIRKKHGRIIFLMAVLAILILIFSGYATAYPEEENIQIGFTDEEQRYIETHPDISIAIDTSWVPYGFLDAEGNCAGIIPNMMGMAAQRAGLNVTFVSKNTYKDAINACTSGETMLVSGIADDQEMADLNDILITDPYITIGYSAVTKNKISDLYMEGADYRVALCTGTYAKLAMQKKMPSYEFVEYHSNRECMDAVLKDEADIALVANYSAGYFETWHEYRKLQTIQINDFNWKLCFGVRKDTDPLLMAIINKSIATISENDVNQAIYSGATEAASSLHRPIDVLYEQPVLVAVSAGLVVALIASMIFVVNAQRKKAYEEADERSRRELQESSDIAKAAMSSARMTVWTYDVATHRITQSKGSEKQHGMGAVVNDVPDGLISRGFVHPESADEYRRAFIAIETANRPIQGDFLVKTADGSGYWWERMILTPVVEDGMVKKAIGTSINVTDQKEKENQYLRIVDEMNDADTEGLLAKGRYNITKNIMLYYSRNSQGSLVLEKTATFDHALEMMVSTAATDSDGQKLEEQLNRQSLLKDFDNGKTDGAIEYKRNSADGAAFWSLLKYSMFAEPNSGDIIFFVYTYDITEQVRENRMLAKLGATGYDVLGLIDVKTHQFESKSIKGVRSLADSHNAYIKGVFEEVVHRQVVATVNESEKAILEAQLTVGAVVKKLETMEVFTLAFTARRSNQSYRRKQLNFTYLDDSKTTIFYYCTDITEMYDREQKQLEKTEEALKVARAASESKTEFFSRMSHDMRTPMNGILGIANLSEDETDPVVLKQNIAKIEESGRYLLGLINDTLDFQRIESGKLQLEPEIVNCNDIIQSILDMVQVTIKKKKIDFQVINRNVVLDCFIKADPVRMKQIFLNLLSNAVKFTPEGGKISFEYECLKRDGMISSDRFIIRDTGVGMSEDFIQHKIFRPFSQERNMVSSQYAGSGLGLSIVKKLVDLMGGTITVESELGVGTTFMIYLDIERVNAEEVAKETEHSAKKQNDVLQSLRGRQVLLAEDHPLNAEIARKLLEKVGCVVTWAKDGRECVDVFTASRPHQFDMILMDIRMPVLDGLASAREIRALKREDAAAVPIIAMTANAYEEDIRKSMEAGMNAHLSKPIEPAKMYETMAGFMV